MILWELVFESNWFVDGEWTVWTWGGGLDGCLDGERVTLVLGLPWGVSTKVVIEG